MALDLYYNPWQSGLKLWFWSLPVTDRNQIECCACYSLNIRFPLKKVKWPLTLPKKTWQKCWEEWFFLKSSWNPLSASLKCHRASPVWGLIIIKFKFLDRALHYQSLLPCYVETAMGSTSRCGVKASDALYLNVFETWTHLPFCVTLFLMWF